MLEVARQSFTVRLSSFTASSPLYIKSTVCVWDFNEPYSMSTAHSRLCIARVLLCHPAGASISNASDTNCKQGRAVFPFMDSPEQASK